MTLSDESKKNRIKVGIFTLLGFLMVGAFSVYVNDRPFWWRACQLVHISVDDATGLKTKSPVRSLGLEIGYLRFVSLSETAVKLSICITAPVVVLPETKAYIRSEGFLGDKFVELKPVRYVGEIPKDLKSSNVLDRIWSLFRLAEARAEDPPTQPQQQTSAPNPGGSREIPVQGNTQDVSQVVNRVDVLVNELTKLTQNVKESVHPEEIRETMRQLNRALEHASRTLSPEGNLNTTAQRTLAKLEDAIEQVRDMVTRVNKGEGSLGMLLNDPTYAEEIREMIRNANQLLSRVGGFRFVVDIGGEKIMGYDGGRGWGRIAIHPKPYRYYLLGVTVDPRGKRTKTVTTTTKDGVTSVEEKVEVVETGIQYTAMLGRIFWDRLDLALGLIQDNGALSVAYRLGPSGRERNLFVQNDLYFQSGIGVNDRLAVQWMPYDPVYVRAGMEGFRKVDGKFPLFIGAGVHFDDEDVKLLFAFL